MMPFLIGLAIGLLSGALGGYRLGKGAWPWQAIKVDL